MCHDEALICTTRLEYHIVVLRYELRLLQHVIVIDLRSLHVLISYVLDQVVRAA